MQHLSTDVLVVGGGLGGVAAARAAARAGRQVVLTEETWWIGGQLTSQAVPLDEHPWIEQFGCTQSYRELRDGIREHYRRWYPLTARARRAAVLNPGSGRVGKICAEPRAALAVLQSMLAPYLAAGILDLRLETRPVAAETDRDRVTAVVVDDARSGETVIIEASYVLDATETGELLPLAGAEYVTGAESQEETGEPHAAAEPQPLNMQAVTHCMALDHRAGEDHTIDRPDTYARWQREAPAGWPGPLLAWEAPDPKTGQARRHHLDLNPDRRPVVADLRAEGGARDLWAFRRIIDRHNFLDGFFPSDVTIANWPMLDFVGGPLYDVAPSQAARHRCDAVDLSRSFLYWLQTAAPRPDGGHGYPGLRLRPDVVGTPEGFAKHPYIRESRRIHARTTVVEQDVSAEVRGPRGAVAYKDSVGVGCYRIDLHPSTGGDPYIDVAAWPFQIPLGALLPVRLSNLLPAAKNIGTTHITNGCYRLHPVEWNVGEVAGLVGAHCLDEGVTPAMLHDDAAALEAFQRRLREDGVELQWPEVGPY